MATTDGLKLPIPELTEMADGPDAFSDLGNAVEDYLLDRILPTGVTRAPGHHWGAVSVLPTGAALRAGDTASYTTYKVLIVWNGTAWRQAEIPAVASDDTTVGFYAGQLRVHSGLGLQRWTGTAWGPAGDSSAPGNPPELPYGPNVSGYVEGGSGAQWSGVRYWKRNGIVTVTGAYRYATASTNLALIGTLPEGFRPPATVQGSPKGILWTNGEIRQSGAQAAGFIDSFIYTFGVA